jgi:glutaredoxin
MNKKIIIPTILFAVVLVFSFAILLKGEAKNGREDNKQESEIILFYGIGCPHCAEVEEYIKQNQVDSKTSLVQKEVYYNPENAKELEEKAQKCGLITNSIGVPFLWDGKSCIIGDRPIIDFFKQKINTQ